MNPNVKNFLTIVLASVLGGIVVVLGLGFRHPQSLGGTTNLNDLEVDSIRSVSSTITGTANLATITASGTVTVTGRIIASGNSSFVGLSNTSGTVLTAGTLITGFGCATSSIDVASLAVNATSTYDFTITGATTTAGTNQVYQVFNQTSSVQGGKLQVLANPSSTQGIISLLLKSQGGTYIGQSVFSVCRTVWSN